jgi:hypothetical protein
MARVFGDSMRRVAVRAWPVLICLAITSSNAESRSVWFQKHILWQAGNEPRVWETTIVSPNGKEHYRLALVPLWAVEGGIVGIEILVASPEHPDDNLLGQREMNLPQPFVITVEELEGGIKKSRFGSSRVFNVGRAKVHVEVEGSRLGEERGGCDRCKNIPGVRCKVVLRDQIACGGSEPTSSTRRPLKNRLNSCA